MPTRANWLSNVVITRSRRLPGRGRQRLALHPRGRGDAGDRAERRREIDVTDRLVDDERARRPALGAGRQMSGTRISAST